MNPERLQYLFEQWFAKTASAKERTELGDLLNSDANRAEMMELFAAAWEKYQGDGNIIAPERGSEMLQSILKNKDSAPVREISPARRIPWGRIAAAAIVVIMLGAGSYFYFNKKQPATEIAATPVVQDVKAPAINRAMITLSNGQKLFLDSAANGTLAQQGQINIIKTGNGQIAYNVADLASPNPSKGGEEKRFNTLSNPRGSQVVNLTLSDGTKVWLNAESSLTYPTAFNGTDRKVTITGEAYFEVAHDAAKPFTVSKGTTSVQVLGTHFNVNAYDDESMIKVTLLEGSVRVAEGNVSRTIRPGDQAQIASPNPSNSGESIKLFSGVDTDEIMAWKDGKFKFSSVDIETILRQAARWYDVDIEYKGKANETFSGGIGRTENISQLLHILEITKKVRFDIEGKKITVKPAS